MFLFRHHLIRRLAAIIALAGALLHAGVMARHAVMQVAAASISASGSIGSSEATADLWALQAGALICHGVADAASGGSRYPADKPAPGSTCPVCLAALVALASVDHVTVSAPNVAVLPERLAVLEAAQAHGLVRSSFEARGPPARA